jgi:hypothetical protein
MITSGEQTHDPETTTGQLTAEDKSTAVNGISPVNGAAAAPRTGTPIGLCLW